MNALSAVPPGLDVLTSSLLSMPMDGFPLLIAVGAPVLGSVGTEMMITDPYGGNR